jgi:hypothetical protein
LRYHKDMTNDLFKKLVAYLIDLYSHAHYSFVVCEIFAVTMILVANSSIEISFFKLFAYTLNLGKSIDSSMAIGQAEILRAVGIWVLGITLVKKMWEKFVGINIGTRIFLAGLTILHVVAGVRAPGVGVGIIWLYGFAVFNFLIYVGVQKLSTALLSSPAQRQR